MIFENASRENWEGNILVYRPVFAGGWSPGAITYPDEELEELAVIRNHNDRNSSSDRSAPKKPASSLSSDDGYRSANTEALFRQNNGLLNGFCVLFRNGGYGFDDFRDELMDRNVKIALVTHSRERQNHKELTMTKGEYLHVSLSAWFVVFRCKSLKSTFL